MGGDSRLHALLEDSERFLLQGDYFKAEKLSRKALSCVAELLESTDRVELGDRAGSVFLQALFETNRSVIKILCCTLNTRKPPLIHDYNI